MITDPPYGVDYSGKNEFLNKFDKGNHIQKPINNDAITDYRKFFSAFMGLAPLAEYNTVYIFMSNKELHSLRLALDDCGYSWGDYLVWVKNNHVLGRKDYNAKHEFIVYGWKGKHKFYGEASATTVLEYNRPLRSELHPTMKPVELVCKLISDGTPAKGKIYDPFGGSGSTLIAAEQLNRTCYMMELDPGYCDVIINRWEQFTGDKAVRLDE
jgi:DNA modification methylase